MKIKEIFTKQDESNFIRESWNSGRLSVDEYLELVSAHYSTKKLIRESLDINIMNEVERMLSTYGDNNPVIDKKYIPVQIVVLNDSIMLHDINNSTPPKQMARFFTLRSMNDNVYLFLDEDGNKRIYPNKKLGGVAYINTVLVPSKEKYHGLQHYVAMVFEKSLPDIQQDSVEETILGSKPKRNPKYLGNKETVANISPVLGAKPKKQTALMKNFFGSS